LSLSLKKNRSFGRYPCVRDEAAITGDSERDSGASSLTERRLVYPVAICERTAPQELTESWLRIRVASVRLRSAIFSKIKEPLSSVGIWGRGRKAAAFY
jgi:hypothetical protein